MRQRCPAILCRDGPHRPLSAVRRIEQDRLDVAGERRARLLLLERRVRDEVQVATVLAPVEGEELVVLEREVRLKIKARIASSSESRSRRPPPRASAASSVASSSMKSPPPRSKSDRTRVGGVDEPVRRQGPVRLQRHPERPAAGRCELLERLDRRQFVWVIGGIRSSWRSSPTWTRRPRSGAGKDLLVQVVEVVMEAQQEIGERVEVELGPVAERVALLRGVVSEDRAGRPEDRHLGDVSTSGEEMAQPGDVRGELVIVRATRGTGRTSTAASPACAGLPGCSGSRAG